jgi:MATE family multidrug resistance protein
VAATRRAGFSALALGIVFMTAMTLLIVATRDVLPLLFLGRDAPDPETVSLAALLLLVGATFFIADGMQTVAVGALRGLNDTRIPLLFAAISFWLIGFSGCWLFAFTLGYGAYGIWIGLSVGLAAYAVLLTWRFHLLTARHYLPAILTTAPS